MPLLLLLLGCTKASSFQDTSLVEGEGDVITLVTSAGEIVLDLDFEAAPVTCTNFLAYLDAGHYDGADGQGATIFHRVIEGFVIQGGSFTAEMQFKEMRDPIINESGNGLLNLRGSVAMARTSDPNSATAGFYINLVDNDALDGGPRDGYAVFGEVIEGLDVVDAIGAVETGTVGSYEDVPLEPIEISSATR